MKRYILGISAAVAMGAFSACDLDEYNPTQLSADQTLSTQEGIYGMQALCYQPIYAQLYSVFDFMQMAECGTDIWWCDRNRTNCEQMFYYEKLTPETNKAWDKAFTQMYAALGLCNKVIQAGAENEEFAVLSAEAKFLRAFYHLQLTTYYGPITLVTTSPDEAYELKPKRNTLSEIYTSVIKDLKEAEAVLPVTQANRARATKKAAKGLLCRAYAQGAGQGLSENGISYWQRAKEESEDFIARMSEYGASLYDDVSDTWADANNRSNSEFLFVAAGQDATDDTDAYNSSSAFSNKLFAYCYCSQKNFSELSLIDDEQYDPLYGRTNQSLLAPSEYLLHCYNPTWDKRWEYSFQTAYFGYSMHREGSKKFNDSRILWAEEDGDRQVDMSKYGVEFSDDKKHRIIPYVDLKVSNFAAGGKQYVGKVWPKGKTAIGTSIDNDSIERLLIDVKKIYAVDYPLADDDTRFYLYLYPEWAKEYQKGYDKEDRPYCSVKIGSLFTDDAAGYRRYITNQEEFKVAEPKISKTTDTYTTRPSLNKFIWNYEGVYYSSNLQIRNGDVAVMRMAEIYLIAAEAEQKIGNEAKAAEFLNVLRKRAARSTAKASDYELSAATEEDILDEYARELCGEFQRWALLQRHGALADRLTRYNGRAAQSYKPYMVWRPISATFLQQIDNKEEYGDNGYGTTAKSGLDGFLQ